MNSVGGPSALLVIAAFTGPTPCYFCSIHTLTGSRAVFGRVLNLCVLATRSASYPR